MLHKTQLLSDTLQQSDDWLNSPPLDARVRQRVLTFLREHGRIPDQIRMNPLSVIDLPVYQWYTFQFFAVGRMVYLPVISDAYVPCGDIECISLQNVDEVTRVMEAVKHEAAE